MSWSAGRQGTQPASEPGGTGRDPQVTAAGWRNTAHTWVRLGDKVFGILLEQGVVHCRVVPRMQHNPAHLCCADQLTSVVRHARG